MANIGAGIGAFMEGLAGGVKAVGDIDRDAAYTKYLNAKMASESASEARDAAKAERDKPLEDAKREHDLATYQDAATERGILRGIAPSQGTAAQSNNVATPGTATPSGESGAQSSTPFADRWRETQAPILKQHYVQTGQLDKANALDKWLDDDGIKRGIETNGRVMSAYHNGDLDGVKTGLNQLFSNKRYFPSAGWDTKVELVKDESATPIGLRITRTGPRGERSVSDLNGDQEIVAGLQRLNPQTAFDYGKHLLDDKRNLEKKRAEEGFQAEREIAVEREKQTTKRMNPTLTAADRKAIFEADDSVAAAQNAVSALDQAIAVSPKASGFPGAGAAAKVGSLLPSGYGGDTARETVDLDNIVTGQVLESLKATFGGMPTEGERKVLLEVQGSSSQPDAVRQKIFKRARELASRRIDFNKRRAQELRGGSFYEPGEHVAPSQNAPVASQAMPAQAAATPQTQPAMAQRPAIPSGAIQMLRAKPDLRSHFDEKYGTGASASFLGN